MPSGEEKFSLEEMAKEFDISRVSLGGPIFDREKLDWLNGKYIREDLSDAEFMDQFASWAFQSEKMAIIVHLIKQRVERFSDVADLGQFFISADVSIASGDFEHKSITPELGLKILQFSLWHLEALTEWNRESVESVLQGLAISLGLKIRDL